MFSVSELCELCGENPNDTRLSIRPIMTTPRILPLLLATASLAGAQIADTPDGLVAHIPANYTEAKTGSYTLPDPLQLANGTRVTDAKTWFEQRRPEIFKLLEENQYGRVPGRPESMSFEVTDQGTPAFDGKALRKQITIHLTADKQHYVDVLMYLPAPGSAGGSPASRVPVLLQLGWFANNLAAGDTDPGVKVGRRWSPEQKQRVDGAVSAGSQGPRVPLPGPIILPVIERGYGYAVFHYNDIDPDSPDGFAHGIRSAYLKPGQTQPAPEEWGAIAAWGWGVSRILDYLETDPAVDAKKVAILGMSRLGKTVLWTAARDERIAAVIASVSGEGGAALSRRNYGETIAHLVAPTRYPYQFARNYQHWAQRPSDAPFDAHFVLSLIAPRPLLLQTGNTDKWSDPYGEFLAAKAATPVYTLLGHKGIEEYSLPAPGKPLLNRLGYLMHDGGHAILPADWPVFLDFLDRHLRN